MSLNKYEQFALGHYFHSYPSILGFWDIINAMSSNAHDVTEAYKQITEQLVLCEQYEFSDLRQIAEDIQMMVAVLESLFVERPPMTVEGKQLRAVFQSFGEPKSIEMMLDSSFGSDATINGVDSDSEDGVQVSDDLEKAMAIIELKRQRIKRSIFRAEERIRDRENIPTAIQTYHGGFLDGYFKGKISALEDVLDHLDEIEASLSETSKASI